VEVKLLQVHPLPLGIDSSKNSTYYISFKMHYTSVFCGTSIMPNTMIT
jgi:hypothetical protein